ncbi:MAG: hypothetical protein FD169_1873 [Bacillota bacterium]|nr:MAG: hypothetical protein FD169_1873 [Bacillota bacterium]
MNCFIINLGNSDINYESLTSELLAANIETERKEGWDYRAIAKWISQNYETSRHKIDFPIVKQILKQATRDDLVMLIGTDQHNKMSKSDTYPAGELLKKVLQDGFWDDNRNRSFPNVTVRKLLSPANLDKTYKFYLNLLENDADLKAIRGHVYGSITGGTQQMNSALLMVGVQVYNDRFSALYVPKEENDKSGQVEQLSISGNLVRKTKYDFLLTGLATALNRRDYIAIVDILNDNSELLAAFPQAPWRYLRKFVTLLQLRLNFDFGCAVLVADKVGALSKEDAGVNWYVNSVRNELLYLKEAVETEDYQRNAKQQCLLIRELYANLQWKLERNEWADVLSRIFRYQEAVLYYICSTNGAQFSVGGKEARKLYFDPAWISQHPEIGGYLLNKNIIVDCPVNRHNLLGVAKFLAQQAEARDFVKSIEKWEKLADLRNKSVVGHGFRGVSSEHVLHEGQLGTVDDLIKKLIKEQEKLGFAPESHYDAAKKHIDRILQKMRKAKPQDAQL